MKKIGQDVQYRAIEYLAHGDHNYIEIAEKCNISVDTLRDWRKEQEFQDAVQKRCRELLKEQESFLYKAALEQVKQSGSHQHIKLLLDRLGRLEDIADGVGPEYNVMFTWKDKDKEENDLFDLPIGDKND